MNDSNHSTKPTKRALSTITVDPEIQQRAAHLDEATVADYAERIAAGDKFPPVIVFEHEGKLILADGFHRYAAYVEAGKKQIPLDIRKGDRRAAILFAIGANQQHGLRPSRADKRKAIITLLSDPKWSQWSDRTIAKQCGVSPTTVGQIRKELEESSVQFGQMADEPEPTVQTEQIAANELPVIEEFAPGTVQFPERDAPQRNVKRIYARGNKSQEMNTTNIGKRPAKPKTLKQYSWNKRYEETCIEIKRAAEGKKVNAQEAYDVAVRAVSTLTSVLPLVATKERENLLEKLEQLSKEEALA